MSRVGPGRGSNTLPTFALEKATWAMNMDSLASDSFPAARVPIQLPPNSQLSLSHLARYTQGYTLICIYTLNCGHVYCFWYTDSRVVRHWDMQKYTRHKKTYKYTNIYRYIQIHTRQNPGSRRTRLGPEAPQPGLGPHPGAGPGRAAPPPLGIFAYLADFSLSGVCFPICLTIVIKCIQNYMSVNRF